MDDDLDGDDDDENLYKNELSINDLFFESY